MRNRAFSLIELSVVILIIGILLAGVTQSSRLIVQFRLKTAQTLTQSSPVASIRDLVMWFEASSTASIAEAETGGGLAVSTWYDINPQSVTKYNVTASGTKRPLYSENIINGAPALKFDGINDSLILSPEYTLNIAQTSIVVFKPATATENGMLLSTTSNNFGNYQTIRYQGNIPSISTWNGVNYSPAITASANAQIIVFVQNGTAAQFFSNGTALTAGTVINDAYKFGQIGELDVDDQNPFEGYIAEIMIFDRALKAEERKAIEAYLGKKYGIAVS